MIYIYIFKMPCIQCGRTIVEPTVVCKHCGKYKCTSNIPCPNCKKFTESSYDVDAQSGLPIVYSEENKKMCLLCYMRNLMEESHVAFDPSIKSIPKDNKYYYDVYQTKAIPIIATPVVKKCTTSNNFAGLKSMGNWR